MYCAPKEHAPSNFHAFYGEYKAVVNINSCEVMEGELPRKQLRLVLAWAELHQDELKADWKLAMDSELPYKIEPLK